MKTVLISGSGSGMGLLTAQTLIRQGYAVYAGVRDPHGRSAGRREALERYATEHGGYVRVIDMDIHSEESCQAAVDQLVADHGHLDVVIHNAAHLFIGVFEGFTPDQLTDCLNTNVVGAHRLNRAAIPQMRKQGNGVLLYVGSTISRIVTPFVGPYIAGKYALDALAEVTAYEINRFGIETVIVMPGIFPDGTAHFESAVHPGDDDAVEGYEKFKADFDNIGPGLRALLRGADAPIQGVADEIARVLALPKGDKPMRTIIDYSDYGTPVINAVVETQTARVFQMMGYEHLLKVS
ncbi:oxidoreductase [Agrobacterium tumefaciens]|uniref:Oxidoreductase n=1 Tax=Agrobacterium fabrum (strain C58 / ATCC 33970) TaxID=176299 RepID=Q7CW28_AGRFC|nr:MULTISPECIES: SDR family oxidoreductase [Agrobacterium]AAK88582.2 oxidoreductase [Agrobacterium fabrum str. C58]KEY50002.1 oxidoreductase [Agrobacterium tumefaciens]KJX85411.1 short chain oxidoreductase [Agrobacterium tumefaciens]MCX2878496.1 SDR family oxidoreductase [Agrobacterium fabrum]NMV73015.1 SDR family oxidoreductase [Agrobacterium fabrum]